MSDDETTVSSLSPSTKVTILTPTNYHIWAPETGQRLMSAGLLRFVNGKAEKPIPLLMPTKAADTTTKAEDGKGVKSESSSSPSFSASPTWEQIERRGEHWRHGRRRMRKQLPLSSTPCAKTFAPSPSAA